MAKEQFTLFYSGIFSNWWPFHGKKDCTAEDLGRPLFTLNGVEYNCSEQMMMAEKAKLFGDNEILEEIMKPIHPKAQKALGRKIKNFNENVWNKHARPIVYIGNEAKFLQNPDLLVKLLKTKGTTLVEASPYDSIWGIGLAVEDPLALDRATWRGTNWLGEVLTTLREDFLFAQAKGDI
jgi:ribA/ribD-fused uncharacterized protein